MFNDTVLDPAGPVSAATRSLLLEAVGLMLLVVVPVFVLTAFVVWRYREGRGARYAPHWASSRWLEVGIWLGPIVIVVFLWGLVWTRTHALDPFRPVAAPQAPLRIEAVALDWQWLFIYPEQDIASLNRLVLPVGQPVTLTMTSDTVLNALFIPALGGQIYAMAGMTTELNLFADRSGAFLGRNTQFSGDGFSAQTFTADAVDEAGFSAFVSEARASGQSLDATRYAQLIRPTIDGPQQVFARVAPDLFDSIVSRHDAMPAVGSHAGHMQ